jgi:hypothetical protein
MGENRIMWRMEMRDRRKTFRVEWSSPAKLYYGRSVRECIVSNFSNGGAKIIGIEIATVPDEFLLRITPHSRPHRCRVAWRSEESMGVAFADTPDRAGEPALGRRRRVVC